MGALCRKLLYTIGDIRQQIPLLRTAQSPLSQIGLKVGHCCCADSSDQSIVIIRGYERKTYLHTELKTEYETERLRLVVSDPRLASAVSDYLLRNRTDFEYYDRHYGDITYTALYQESALKAERDLYQTQEGVRYYIFIKKDPDTVIGNISFAYLHDKEHEPSLGYKIDRSYRREGYAYEAASFLLPLVIKFCNLPYIAADALPENEASIGLLYKLGFKYAGIIPNAHEILGVMRDHYRYVFDPCS